MNQLNDTVVEVIKDFVDNGILFTALDVSNKVKQTLPLSKHKEVRDIVRSVYGSIVEPNSYSKTPIQVSLTDGSTVEAILYHPLVDSWDLDNKYDAQKRSQVSFKVVKAAPAPVNPAKAPATVTANGTISIAPPTVQSASVTPIDPKDAWKNLFATSPSLFPNK